MAEAVGAQQALMDQNEGADVVGVGAHVVGGGGRRALAVSKTLGDTDQLSK